MRQTSCLHGLLSLLGAAALMLPLRVQAEETSPVAPGHTIDANRLFSRVTERDGRWDIRMAVGTVDEQHTAIRLEKGETAVTDLPATDAGDVLLVRFVIPDDLEGHHYDLALKLNDTVIHERSGATRGFGRRSLFIPLPHRDRDEKSTRTLALENRCDERLFVTDLELLPGFGAYVERPPKEKDFTLSLLIGERLDPERLDRMAGLIDAPPVRKAIGHEIYYAVRTNQRLEEIAKATREVCDRLDVDFLALTCSWWAGTPPQVKERLDYQQVCWSETDDYDEGEGLRKLLGDKWDIRYGLSVPNKWSSTPWQTMNNPELNQMRHKRNAAAVRILEEHLKDRMIGYVSENEPAYWAFEESDEKYPVRRRPLWADFNPQTVADALQDGVVLDPKDGLDMIERTWLLYNVARYNEASLKAIRRGNPSGAIYSHALLDYNHFPLHGTGHARPYAEAARVTNARLGVEMIWGTDMDALWRVREWGPWGCINREECDGFDIRYHVATLRACYMLGADLLNSYNWSGMGREGDPIVYFNTFLREVGENAPVVVAERTGGREWVSLREWSGSMEKNAAFPWFNEIELPLRCDSKEGVLNVWVTRQSDKAVVAYQTLHGAGFAEASAARIDFGDLAWLRQDDLLTLHLRPEGRWSVRSSDDGPDYRLLCDLSKERRRSKVVIGASEGVRFVSLNLRPRQRREK